MKGLILAVLMVIGFTSFVFASDNVNANVNANTCNIQQEANADKSQSYGEKTGENTPSMSVTKKGAIIEKVAGENLGMVTSMRMAFMISPAEVQKSRFISQGENLSGKRMDIWLKDKGEYRFITSRAIRGADGKVEKVILTLRKTVRNHPAVTLSKEIVRIEGDNVVIRKG